MGERASAVPVMCFEHSDGLPPPPCWPCLLAVPLPGTLHPSAAGHLTWGQEAQTRLWMQLLRGQQQRTRRAARLAAAVSPLWWTPRPLDT
jgi:hypothetical protein